MLTYGDVKEELFRHDIRPSVVYLMYPVLKAKAPLAVRAAVFQWSRGPGLSLFFAPL